jgi:hypothetical protein
VERVERGEERGGRGGERGGERGLPNYGRSVNQAAESCRAGEEAEAMTTEEAIRICGTGSV